MLVIGIAKAPAPFGKSVRRENLRHAFGHAGAERRALRIGGAGFRHQQAHAVHAIVSRVLLRIDVDRRAVSMHGKGLRADDIAVVESGCVVRFHRCVVVAIICVHQPRLLQEKPRARNSAKIAAT